MKQIWRYARWPLIFVMTLWAIEGLSVYFHYRPVWLGIIPRTISGIPGIFFSAFIHGNYEHLLSNTLPLLLIGTGVFYFYNEIAWRVISLTWFLTGIWVWLFARPDAHIGASGLIYALVCFIFFSGIIRRDTRLLAVSLLVTFLYGSMVWGILPVDQSISFESHLFGSAAGIFCAIYYRKIGPKRQKAQWEIDEETEALSEATDEEFSDIHPTQDISSNVNIQYHYTDKNQDESKQ